MLLPEPNARAGTSWHQQGGTELPWPENHGHQQPGHKHLFKTSGVGFLKKKNPRTLRLCLTGLMCITLTIDTLKKARVAMSAHMMSAVSNTNAVAPCNRLSGHAIRSYKTSNARDLALASRSGLTAPRSPALTAWRGRSLQDLCGGSSRPVGAEHAAGAQHKRRASYGR
jgi:hypothetical protein